MIAHEQPRFYVHNDSIADALTLKSLAHPTRLKILMILDKSECCVKHLWECLGMEQAGVSQHLAVLKNRGIIKSNRSKTKMIYTIVNPLAQKIVATLHQN